MREYASGDFETKSEAGIFWDGAKLVGPPGASKGKRGLPVIGGVAYAQHPSTDILTFSWALPDGRRGRWQPGQPLAHLLPLFDYLAAGGVFAAHNIAFEWWIWHEVAVKRYGWPPLAPERIHCTVATANVNGFPAKLALLGPVLGLPVRKDADGTRLLNKFSVPNKPTKARAGFWTTPADDPADAERLYAYCDTDVDTERHAGRSMPPMSAAEREFWLVDQEINRRGIAIDREGVRACLAVLSQVLEREGARFRALVGFEPTQLEKFKGWLAALGVHVDSLDADHRGEVLGRKGLPPLAREALEILDLVGSASVKKLFAMDNMASREDRLHHLIIHHGARTGRPTGEGPQPLNLPKAGPKLCTCETCGEPFHPKNGACPWCGVLRKPVQAMSPKARPAWRPEMLGAVMSIMATRRVEAVERFFGDAVQVIMGCVRGMFKAGLGHHLVASDYSAIEAVVTAFLSGEEWRMEAFRQGKPMYLMSASKITGTPLEEYERYKAETGEHHPDRQYIGKVAELALGFGGWIGGWRGFDDTDRFTDEEVKQNILAWRRASPKVVELWGGQTRRGEGWGDARPELYGFEGAAVAAVKNPGQVFDVRGIKFFMRPAGTRYDAGPEGWAITHAPALIIRLLSGRELTYWEPALGPPEKEWAKPWEVSLSYMTWNTNPKYGPKGWVRMKTYGGRLAENIIQATAHCILRHAILQLRAIGIHTVLHVYDEIIAEVPAWVGPDTLATVERVMSTMPWWCADWPVSASGGWRSVNYCKAA